MVKNMLMMGVVMVMAAAAAGASRAEDAFGIPVYPGAKQDAMTQKKCGQRADMKCFRTTDDFSKVLAFYEKQPALEMTQFARSMPPDMLKEQRTGKKKVFELCRKPASELCGFAELPAVRLNSPWSTKANLSPAAKLEEYDGQDVFIMITGKK